MRERRREMDRILGYRSTLPAGYVDAQDYAKERRLQWICEVEYAAQECDEPEKRGDLYVKLLRATGRTEELPSLVLKLTQEQQTALEDALRVAAATSITPPKQLLEVTEVSPIEDDDEIAVTAEVAETSAPNTREPASPDASDVTTDPAGTGGNGSQTPLETDCLPASKRTDRRKP